MANTSFTHTQGTTVRRHNWHSAVSLGWPFPMLKCKYIFHIKYMEEIFSNSTWILLWFEISIMLIEVLKNKSIVLFIIIFGILSFSMIQQSTDIHTHPFNGPLSGTTQVSRYQKGKTNLDFTVARDSEWQWDQLGHMQVCTSLQTDNHTSTSPLSFYRPLPAAQPTTSKH